MKTWSYEFFLIIAFWLGLGSAFSGVLFSSIRLSETDYHFKEAEEGTILSHDYLVKNTGSAVLRILDVRPG